MKMSYSGDAIVRVVFKRLTFSHFTSRFLDVSRPKMTSHIYGQARQDASSFHPTSLERSLTAKFLANASIAGWLGLIPGLETAKS